MEKVSWSPKIRQSKIRQLYQNDALGAVDEVLVEDVGLGLLYRCRSIWLVTRTARTQDAATSAWRSCRACPSALRLRNELLASVDDKTRNMMSLQLTNTTHRGSRLRPRASAPKPVPP